MLPLLNTIYKRSKAALFVAAFMLFSNVVYCQIGLRLDSLGSCSYSENAVSVHVAEFEGVNAITLYIQLDTLHATYTGIANAHPNLSGGSLIGNCTFSNNSLATIVVTWYRLSPLILAQGKLFDLLLHYKEGTANLNFGSGCEIAKGIQVVENVTYTNGVILPLIYSQPVPASHTEGEQAIFFVNQNTGNTYLWQANYGSGWLGLSETYPYQGSLTHQLTIQALTLSMNNYRYRCVVSGNGCESTSDSAILLVSPLNINEHFYETFGFKVFPNPNNGIFHLTTNLTFKNISLSLLDFSGKMIYSKFFDEFRNRCIEPVNVSNLQKGIYLIQLSNNERLLHKSKVIIY